MKRLLMALLFVLPATFASLQPQEAQARHGWAWFVKNTHPGPHCAGGATPTTYYGGRGLGVATYNHPKGTRLLVTNCNNGRTVVVVVNDRGPAKYQRSLGIHYDLSYQAAKAIALGQNGRFESGWTSITVLGSADAKEPTVEMSAKRHAYRRFTRRGNCDGFIRCRCGTTAAADNGLPLDYMGLNLKKASEYRKLPRASFGAGAIAVKPGGHHVASITGGSDCAHAMIHDDAGSRERNVCGWTFVTARGGIGVGVQYSARERRGRRGRASYSQAAIPDRMTATY